MLIPVLQDVQAVLGYLPEEALRQVSIGLNVPLTRVYAVATFYKAFSLKPRGLYTVRVCCGTACHVRGAPRLVDAIQRHLKIAPGDTTKDKMFTLETVNCLGACALAPVVVVGEQYHEKMNPDRLKKLLDGLAESQAKVAHASNGR